MRVKRLVVTLLLCVFLVPLFSLTLEDVLPALSRDQIEQLYAGELVEGKSFSYDVKILAPQGSISEQHLVEALQKPESFTVVSLSYIPYSEVMRAMTSAQRQLYIFNTMRAISTQEGITYISYRAGNKPKELIEKSWYLATPKSRSSLPDPVSSTVPPEAQYYVYQKDSSFKSNVYRHSYMTTADEIFVKVENLETMRVFGLFKAVEPEMLAIAMSTLQVEDGLLLSAMATIEGRDPKVKVLGYTVDLPSAFTRRTTALGEWFKDQLNR
jgi:hypothetical protein